MPTPVRRGVRSKKTSVECHNLPERASNLQESKTFTDRRRWLAVVAGRIPQINPYTTRDPLIQVFQGRLANRTVTDIHQDSWKDISNPDQELGVNMAKLSIVVNKFFRDVYTSTEKHATAYEKYLHLLEVWSSSLPPNLRYFPDHSAGETNPTFSTTDELSSVSLISSLALIPMLTIDSSTLKYSISQL